MADIIQLLPDNIANQIAAGEVIQRPASVVKELLENAVDAGSGSVKLVIKDSGKTMIQVIDDGVGMSEMDARMSFERHATSKIRTTEDLFKINTKGFRGEALASIAAIAHVELITRQASSDTGVKIAIAGSKINSTEVVSAPVGSSFTVKNIFFNIPARRKFLKSDPVELKHIIEEFFRVSITHPEIYFVLIHNDNDVYHLPKANLKQRLVSIFGKSYNEKLLPVYEATELLKIEGFIAKAEAAKKTSSDQYLFVNNRFVKNNYLNHAIKSSYEGLLQKDQYPVFFINIEIDPDKIDINISPTKTEIKFDDERLVYNYLRVAVKHALGVFVVAPTLDFSVDTNFARKYQEEAKPNPSAGMKTSMSTPSYDYRRDVDTLEKENLKAWQNIYKGVSSNLTEDDQEHLTMESDVINNELPFNADNIGIKKEPYQIHVRYIVSQIKSGFVLIDQQYAHERILYEENLTSIHVGNRPIQKELFPLTIELDAVKSVMMTDLIPYLTKLGFEIGAFGQNTFIIHGLPAGLPNGTNATALLEKTLDQYHENVELQLGLEENIARSYAYSACVKRGTHLTGEQMNLIIDKLFACKIPYVSPSGHKCFIDFTLDALKAKFL